MNFYAFSSLIASAGAFTLGTFVLAKDPKQPLNRVFFLYCLTGSFWAFTEFGYRQAESYQMARYWFQASSLALAVVPLEVHFVLYFTKNTNILKYKLTYVALYLPPLIFLVLDYKYAQFYQLVQAYWGWTYIPNPNLSTALFDYWFTIGMVLALGLSFTYFIRTKTPLDRSRAIYVTLAIGIITLFSFVSEPGGIFSILGLAIPELTSFGFMFACTILTYAIWRWELFDISPRTAAESIIATMNDALFLVNRDGEITQSNQASLNLLGFQEGELDNLAFEALIDRDSRAVFRTIYADLCASTNKLSDLEVGIQDKENNLIPISLSGSQILDNAGTFQGVVFVGRNLTERKRAEQQIRASLLEKETLLQEIHHRVKNNMQVISSMLVLQSRTTDDEHAMTALQDSRSRIQSMAIVHEMLYQSEGLSQVDFQSYVKRLVDQIHRTQVHGTESIEINFDIENIRLDIDSVINCGLIINELVTNSFKHAFEHGQKGEILIKLAALDDYRIALKVEDNGVGLSSDVRIDDSEKLGLQLVNILASQMGGTMSLDRTNGTGVTVIFKLK